MKKFICLFITLFSIIFSIPSVFAYTNLDTFYNIDIPEVTGLLQTPTNNSNYSNYVEFYDYLINLNNNNANLGLQIAFSYNNSLDIVKTTVYIYDSQAITLPYSYYGTNASSTKYLLNTYFNLEATHGKYYELSSLDSSNTNFQSVITCLSGGTCNLPATTSTYLHGNPFMGYLDNNSSYTVDFSSMASWYGNYNATLFYYTSIPFAYETYSDNSNSNFIKSITINDVNYGVGSLIPTYKDLYFPSNDDNQPTIIDTSIGNIFIGAIPVNNISNLNYTGSFYYNDIDYVNSLNPLFLYFGRKNNTTYYSYEPINCSGISGTLSSFAIDEDLKKVNFSLLPYGLTCSDNLSQYDNIYIRVYFQYNSYTDTTVIAYDGRTSEGKTTRLSDTQSTYVGAYIYEPLENLSSDFSYVLSTEDPEIKAYYISSNNYINMLHINLDNNNYVEAGSFNPISYGTATHKNVILYNLENYFQGVSYVDLFLNYKSILSPRNNNSYTYYDVSGSLASSDIINDRGTIIDNSYDTTYYKNVVSSFIDELSLEVTSFATIIQLAYDTAPQFLQIFIYVMFILVCFKFIFDLIRK